MHVLLQAVTHSLLATMGVTDLRELLLNEHDVSPVVFQLMPKGIYAISVGFHFLFEGLMAIFKRHHNYGYDLSTNQLNGCRASLAT